MDGNEVSQPSFSRPYFIPADLDYDALPEQVRLAISEILMPLYDELVLGAASSLQRAAAVSLAYLLFLELHHQFVISRELDFRPVDDSDKSAERNEAIDRYARLVGAKQKVAGFLLRLQEVDRRDPLRGIFTPPLANEGPEIGKSDF